MVSGGGADGIYCPDLASLMWIEFVVGFLFVFQACFSSTLEQPTLQNPI